MHEVTPVLQEGSPLQRPWRKRKAHTTCWRSLSAGLTPSGVPQAYPFAVRRGVSHRGFPT
jgi:hypothetical protein